MVGKGTRTRTVAALALALLAVGCGATEEGGGGGPAGVQPAAGAFGGRLQTAAEFTVVVIATGESAGLDFVGIACAPDGTLTSGPVKVAESVAVENGNFTAQSADVAVEGEFTSPTEATGTIRALTPDAEGCGIPADGSWTSTCDMSVAKEQQEEADTGGIVVGGVMGTTEGGTAFATFEVVTEDGDRLAAELLDSGTCPA